MAESPNAYIRSVRPAFERTLRQWVAIPTVSAVPEHRDDIRRAADTVVGCLRERGGEAEAVSTDGLPAVVAAFGHEPAHRTVLIYNHLDVQPANEPEWRSPPFEMQTDGDIYRGRGTTDDKGPALTALFAACYARQIGVPINIRFVWEFEEEIGSPSFEAFVAANLERLRADSVVISDTVWISRSRPAIPFGLRGLLSLRLVLETGTRDVHSGLTGGGARNPITELCGLVASFLDQDSGRILIPGFYDGVRPVGEDELAGFLASGFTRDGFMASHELRRIREGDAGELMRRLWTEPTFEVHGVVGGYLGPGVKTAIPPRAEVKVSLRLVPDQSPKTVFEKIARFVASQNPDVEVVLDSILAPFLGPQSGPYADAARDAVASAFGTAPASIREGGSIGAVVTLRDHLGVPIIFLGLSLPEHGYHAPNENFDWGQASGGMRMFIRYFENIARL